MIRIFFFSFKHEVNKSLQGAPKTLGHSLGAPYAYYIAFEFSRSFACQQVQNNPLLEIVKCDRDLCDWFWHCFKGRLNVLVMYFFYNTWSIYLSNHRIQVFFERVENTSFIDQSILFKLISLVLKVSLAVFFVKSSVQ